MTLRDYLAREKLTPSDYARRLGVSHTAVHRYINGRIPIADIVMKIYRDTSGEVGPADWYGIDTGKLKKKGSAEPTLAPGG